MTRSGKYHYQGRNPVIWIQNKVLPVLISFAGAFVSLYPVNPNNMTLPSRDSGVFLYIGWRLVNGDIPYQDVWDHKPPFIYFIDALGLVITPDSLWGVWLLQFIFIFITFLLVFNLLDREFGISSALAGTIILASGLLALLEQGNVTEEYALVFQAACVLLFVTAHKSDYPLSTTFWVGVLAGLAFNFKQSTIGIWVAYGFILFVTRLFHKKSPLQDLLSLFVGWSLPNLVVILYFASRNSLTDLWEQAYLYNFIYIGKEEGIRRFLPVFMKGYQLLSQGGTLYFASLGWVAGLVYLWMFRKNQFNPLIVISVVSLPIEIGLITVSGRSIIHYYLTLLPVVVVLAGSLVYTFPQLIKKFQRASHLPKLGSALLFTLILLFQFDLVQNYSNYVQSMAINEYAPVIEYVRENTTEKDQVLIIGAESVINFLVRREAPTRYVYQYPLALLGRRPMFEEYFNQILENKPELIIDTRGRANLTDKLYEPLQKRSEIVREGVETLSETYERVAHFGDWAVYGLIDNP